MSALGRPRFLTKDQVLGWHEVLVAQFGGVSGIRDDGLLESALAMPSQGFGGTYLHEFPFDMAAAYAFHLAKNHPFHDGNKRIALGACVGFLRMNGWNLLTDGTDAADAILGLVAGTMNKAIFSQWLREHSVARPSIELRDFMASLTFATLGQQFAAVARSPRTAEIQATIEGACIAVPCIAHAWLGSRAARNAGDHHSAEILEQHATLLTAIFRIAEDMGYEW